MKYDKTLPICFLTISTITICLITFLPVRYAVNDDIAVISILSGQAGFAGYPYSVVLNPISDFIIYYLYVHFPLIPWYGLFIYSATIIGFSLIFSIFFRTLHWKMLIPCLPILFLMLFWHITFVTFTSASMLLLFGVLLCIFEIIIKKKQTNKTYALFLMLGIILAILLRWKLVLYSIIFAFPLVFFSSNIGIKKSFRSLYYITPILVVIICSFCISDFALRSEEKNFLEFVKLRRNFFATAEGDLQGEKLIDALNRSKWSIPDYILFKNYFSYDNETFNTNKLKKFMNKDAYQLDYFKLLKTRTVRNLKSSTPYNLIFLITLVSTCLAGYQHWRTSNSKYKYKTIIILGGLLSSTILLITYDRFVLRVFGPLFLYIIGIMYLLFEKHKSNDKSFVKVKLNFYSLLLLPLFAVNLILTAQVAYSMNATLKQSKIFNQNEQLIFQSIKKIYPTTIPLLIPVSPGIDTSFQNIHPLKELSYLEGIKLFPYGWMIGSPYYNNILKNLNLSTGREFLKWTVNKNDVLYFKIESLSLSKPKLIKIIESYFTFYLYQNENVLLKPAIRLKAKNYQYTFYNATR